MKNTHPISIVLMSGAYPPNILGGGEISTQTLAHTLKRQGYDVSVLTLSESDSVYDDESITVTQLSGVNHYWVYNHSNKPMLPKILWKLRDTTGAVNLTSVDSYLQKVKPDIVITSTLENFTARSWKVINSLNIKVIHILRSYYLMCHNSNMFANNSNCETQCTTCKCYSTLKNRYSQHVDAVVGISEHILNEHIKYGYFENAHKKVIYNICYDKFKPKSHTNANLTIGYIGRIHPTKGIEDIIHSLSHPSLTNVRLLIAGTGSDSYVNEIQKLIDEKGVSAHFIGHVQPSDLFEQIDYLIVPSKWHEPFGRVIIEAASHGIPVLGSSYGGIPELIRHGLGKVYSDVDDLSKILIDISTGQYNVTIDQSNLKAFSDESIMVKWHDLITDVMTDETPSQ